MRRSQQGRRDAATGAALPSPVSTGSGSKGALSIGRRSDTPGGCLNVSGPAEAGNRDRCQALQRSSAANRGRGPVARSVGLHSRHGFTGRNRTGARDMPYLWTEVERCRTPGMGPSSRAPRAAQGPRSTRRQSNRKIDRHERPKRRQRNHPHPDGKDAPLTVGSMELNWLAHAQAYLAGPVPCRARSGTKMENRRSRRDNRRPTEARMSRMW